MDFAEVQVSKVLQAELDGKLKQIYTEVRKKEPSLYTKKDGSFKPLSEVKDLVGLSVFPNLMKAIAAEYSACYGKAVSKEERMNPDFYVQYRMLFPVRAFLTRVQKGEEIHFDPIAAQWGLLQENLFVFKEQEQFDLEEGAYSLPIMKQDGKAMFFRMGKKSQVQSLPLEEKERLLGEKRKQAELLGVSGLLQVLCLDTKL
jgi:hypothetical protein